MRPTVHDEGKTVVYERPSTVERAAVAQLRRMILQGDLRPGSFIPLDELADDFGISRGPIRDALRILEGEGLVVAHPHIGYQVSRLDISELEEIDGIRRILETDAIIRAVDNLTDANADEMSALLEQMIELERVGDMATWVGVHRKFHFVVFDAADSSTERRALNQLWNASDLYRAEYLQSEDARARSDAQHGQLLDAVRSRDKDQMLAVMDAHRGSTVVALTRSLPQSAE